MFTLLNNIWAVFLDTAFWLLLGLLAAGFIKSFISEQTLQRWVGGRGLGAVVRAALFGAPLPLCSCGVLPAALGLRRAGASKEATVSFLISTPETSVDSVTVTYALMGPVMAVYRPLAALFSAMMTGMMTAWVNHDDPPLQPVAAEPATDSCCSSSCSTTSTTCCSANSETVVAAPGGRLFQALRYAGAELLDDIAGWMFVGIVAAGVMLTWVPPGWLAQWGHGLAAMLVMLVVGIPMYICAVASTPLAAGLLLAGVSPGVVLVFLLVGPATNIGSIALVRKELGTRITLVYLLGLSLASIAAGLLLEWLLVRIPWGVEARLGQAHELLPGVLTVGSAVLLLVLAIRPLRVKLLPQLS